MSSVKIYGIPNCDTIKKATNWLKNNDISYTLHDYKKSGITEQKLKEWCKHFGWENVLNKKSATWLESTEEERNAVATEGSAIAFMIDKTSSIKRPVLEAGGKYLIRFNEQEYRQTLL